MAVDPARPGFSPRPALVAVAIVIVGLLAALPGPGAVPSGPIQVEAAGAAGTPAPESSVLKAGGPEPDPSARTFRLPDAQLPAAVRRSPEPAGPDRSIRDVPRPTVPVALSGYVWPLPNGRLTHPFGPSRWGSRIVDGEPFHDGIDLATFCGDRIVAAHAGEVLAAGRRYDRWLGWRGDLEPYEARLDERHLWNSLPIVVVIDDGNGYRSVYAHFSRVVVEPGQRVAAGQLLGYEGRTGRASGCHLHYELFSPFETRTFTIKPEIAERMLLPERHTARIDPLLVFPPRPSPTPAPTPTPTPPSPD